jgi:phosphate uptake regulator
MKRKLVEQGKTTLMVSLPIDWIRKFGLQKGDEIEVDERGGELVIKTEKSFKQNNKAIDLTEYGLMKNRAVLSAYLQGVDELELKFTDIKQIKEIEERVLNELIGFEIIKQTPNSLILKDISGSSEQNFDMILRRTFLVIESMAEELVKSLETGHKSGACSHDGQGSQQAVILFHKDTE